MPNFSCCSDSEFSAASMAARREMWVVLGFDIGALLVVGGEEEAAAEEAEEEVTEGVVGQRFIEEGLPKRQRLCTRAMVPTK